MISVVLLTFNEQVNIRRCLKSLSWCDDIVLIDSFSSDGTCDIACEFGVRIFKRKFDNFAEQRNFALNFADLKYDWVLHVDADEEVTECLHQELIDIVNSPIDSFKGYYISSRLYYMGSWLKYAGMYPSYQARFGLKNEMTFYMHGHGQREKLPKSSMGYLNNSLTHYNFSKGISDWIIKHAKYAKAEAIEIINVQSQSETPPSFFSNCPVERRRAIKNLTLKLPFKPVLRFLYVLIFRMGVLDGMSGFRYAVLMGIYQYMIDLNIDEIRYQDNGNLL